MTDWSRLDAALDQRAPTLWWRDDDAIADTPALHRLMDLADTVSAPLTLAVIPGNLTETLAPAIMDRNVSVAVHGWTHTNHAPNDEKKAEFRDHRPHPEMIEELTRGKTILDSAFGTQSLPLFIPPWNRVSANLPLADLGYRGISVYGKRELTREHNLIRFDAHIDPIDWRGSRSAIPMQQAVDSIAELVLSNAPIGLMTHHLVHDPAIWDLTETLVKRLTRAGATWTTAAALLQTTAPTGEHIA